MGYLDEVTYKKIKPYQDKLLSPVVIVLSKLHITATAVTYSSIILMLFFVFNIQNHPQLSTLLLLIVILLDLIDGTLARFQKTSSDKGKFIDVFNDILVFVIFIWGLVYVDYLPGTVGVAVVFTLCFSKIMRITYNLLIIKTDWRFKAVAGFLPNLFTYLFYINYVVLVFFDINYLLIYSILFSVVLFFDMVAFYYKIIYK